ncbi:hypothetical protein KVG88_02970 [Pseudomonas sp. SWRI74]|jgi:hypothetical protein|uniref:Fap system outer membrane protein n=2 Tax=Pseudomonas TaxID=286 RepID=A0A5E6ZT66_PSEFL|nr:MULTISPECIES: hypothetical protein [Pseudomonas]MBV4519009.1 hypothetical protein [Pseudomonas azerbaijanoccidentalis]MCK8663435.1 hypothetical protein [Pseudomonas azerbaijanoccidentalis]VVN67451.1 hypothetical protein PS712_00191 [Pseudomonas fluorescens]
MKTSYWLAAACLVASTSGFANGFKPIEIKDQELAELRGRYVMPGRIISFGVVMNSTWRNASGDLIGASTSMQIQAATVKPEFYVSTYSHSGNGAPAEQGTGSVVGGAGLASTQGINQSVRAAGDGNSAYNNIAIDVKEASRAPALVPNQGQALMAGQTITGSSAAGSIAVSATNGGVQMAIQANNNQGSAIQQVAQGGLLQNTRLLGNSNMVSNLTQLNVVLNNNGPTVGALDCNLNQLTALRSLGY